MTRETNFISYFFAVPDREREFQRYMVYALTLIWSAITGSIVSVGFYFFPHIWYRWLTFLGVSIFIAFFNILINRLGYTRFASWSLTLMLWLYITIPCYSAGGIIAPGIMTQVCVILSAGFLVGWRGGLAIGLLTITTDFGLAYMEVTGHLPAPLVQHTPITRWIAAIIPFGSILALQYYATNHLRAGLKALQREILKREEAETIKDRTLYNLGERVKELTTLYSVCRIMQDENIPPEKMWHEIVNVLPAGWQYPAVTAARVCIGETTYATPNYRSSGHRLQATSKTTVGTTIQIEVTYLKELSESDHDPFLKEERNLTEMLAEILKIDVERRERQAELKDYKYALDTAAIVSITRQDGCFTFINENFSTVSKYSADELLGKHHSILWSKYHPSNYFTVLQNTMQNGTPFKGEFCNRAKDGTIYWVDTTIVPFLDENENAYQYLFINNDITERKEAEKKIRESEQTLKKITSQVPGNTYVFEIEESGRCKLLFLNRGTDTSNHSPSSEELPKDAATFTEALHDDDKIKFYDAMKNAYRTQTFISFQYKISVDGKIRWRWMQAIPEKNDNGRVIWYGATSDITPMVDYIASIEQVLFDIGHVIRRPISSMIGMTQLINETNLSENEIKELSKNLHFISLEMDRFITELNTIYDEKRKSTKLSIDISSVIDKRSSLFN